MKGFVNRLKSEQGFTLIEMIAAMTLFSLVVGLISTVTMFGFRSYHKITVENALRNEADLIMSSIITELYTFGAEQVRTINGGIELIKNGSSLAIKVDNKVITITENANGTNSYSPIVVKSELGGSTITTVTPDGRSCTVGNSCDSGLIQIKLVLKYEGKEEDRLDMDSQFGF